MQQLLMLHPDLSRFTSAARSIVTPLTLPDASGLGRLLNTAFEEDTWTEEKVRLHLIEAPDILAVFGVLEAGEVIATASARHDSANFPGQGYLHMVATGAAARGRGMGRAVTEAVLAHFAAQGFTEAVLETDDRRTPALRTYLGMGFVPVIRDDSHYRRWSPILAATYRSISVVTSPIATGS